MIVLFTDFGLSGPYVGQVHAELAQRAPSVPIIDLFHDVPNHAIQAGAYLLPAYTQNLPPGSIVVGIVDPGVGGGRRPILMHADQRWYVGPDNGLFHMVARRARAVSSFEIIWRPPRLSASFHGRDLFAPVAALLARRRVPKNMPIELYTPQPHWPDDLAQVLYVDRFGNAITGLRAAGLQHSSCLRVGQSVVRRAGTFEQVPVGQAFWYENSNGLVELAVNQGRADQCLQLALGDQIDVE